MKQQWQLSQWLQWLEQCHPREIDLGLERVSQVWRRMYTQSLPFTVVTVAGTNGKGSSTALLANILVKAGYRTGAYTSPHLLRFNERICVDQQEVSDAEIVAAFTKVDHARRDTSLTYFEFSTLAAMEIFMQRGLDIVVLEVGLGGRLDAVNIFDADVALITAIDIDHTQWLGRDRETIAREKVGIARPGRPCIYSSLDIPLSVLNHANALGAPLYQYNVDFKVEQSTQEWSWSAPGIVWEHLPKPALTGEFQCQNAAGVLMVLSCLSRDFPVTRAIIAQGLITLRLPGRFQILNRPQTAPIILDVAHNVHAARSLNLNLQRVKKGKVHGVVAVLADKDIAGIVRALMQSVDYWYTSSLECRRAALGTQTQEVILKEGGALRFEPFHLPRHALVQAMAEVKPNDCIVVFGSFYTVADILAFLPSFHIPH